MYCEHVIGEQLIIQASQSKWNEYPTIDIEKYLPGVRITDCEDFKRLNLTRTEICRHGKTPHCLENDKNDILLICKQTDTCDKGNHDNIIIYTDSLVIISIKM